VYAGGISRRRKFDSSFYNQAEWRNGSASVS
jgi:hypothetical protein